MNIVKNCLILGLVKLSKILGMRTFFRAHAQAPRILVVSTTGLGDTLWATPAIRAIKSSYPKATVVVLTSAIGKTILSDNPWIDEILTISHRCLFEIPKLLKKLTSLQLDTALIFHTSQRLTLPLCYFARPSLIIGNEGMNKGLDSLLTIKLPQKHQHEIQKRLDIVGKIGATCSTPVLEIYQTAADMQKIRSLLIPLKIRHRFVIGLHPGAKDLFKQWPPSAFIELGNDLYHHLQAQIIITGSKEERPLAELLAQQIPHAINTAGQLSIKESAALLSQLDLFITNDTGPMHMAFASKTKTIALFCPTNPDLCGPFHTTAAQVLRAERSCTPCLKKKCKEPFCMLQHSPKTVLNHAITLLT